jgi:hypothetical protein
MGDTEMGDATLPYAHIVQPRHPILPHTLPDAGLVFDTLLKRKEVGPFLHNCVCATAIVRMS